MARNLSRVSVMVLAACVFLALPTASAWADPPAPALTMLSVGVSKYKSLPKLLSAHKDAQDMASLFRGQKGKLFSDVAIKTLIDTDATATNIRDGLHWVKARAHANSYTMVFLAGHGNSQATGEFEYNPVDSGSKKKGVKGGGNITWKELKGSLQSLPGKAILILDCCSAGAVKSTDNLVVLCGCQAGKISDERMHNGYFTSALMEGLSGKADTDGDGIVTLSEVIAYVNHQVPKTTKGKQLPALVRPANAVTAHLPLASLKAQ